MSIPRLSLAFLSFAMMLAGLAVILRELAPVVLLPPRNFWVVFIFVTGITYIAYTMKVLGLKLQAETGIIAIMASVGVKMVFSMAFVLIYSEKTGDKGGVFVANFFSLYFLFSFFELYTLLRNLRHQNK